jgi:hypothetical protein
LLRRSPGEIGQESVKSMRAKTLSGLLTSTLKLLGHATMGVAIGLAVAFFITRIDALGIMRHVGDDTMPGITPAVLVGIIVLSFAVGTTLTGIVFMVTEDR